MTVRDKQKKIGDTSAAILLSALVLTLVACGGAPVKQVVQQQAPKQEKSECYVEEQPLQAVKQVAGSLTPAGVTGAATTDTNTDATGTAPESVAGNDAGEAKVSTESAEQPVQSAEPTMAQVPAQGEPVAAGENATNLQQLAGAQGGAAKATKPEGKLVCPPKGFIELTEDYTVEAEVKNEFEQAIKLLAEENYELAIRLLKAVTAKSKKFTGPYINLGIAYARSGEFKLAEEALNKALKLNQSHPVANNELGQVYRKTGRYAEARKIYEELLTIYPEFLPARRNLGVLCDIYLQDLNCAVEQFEIYLQEVPKDEQMKIWLAEVKARN